MVTCIASSLPAAGALRTRSTAVRNVRMVSSEARWRLYSALPRMSVTGLQACAASRPASAKVSSVAGCPARPSPTAASAAASVFTAVRPSRAATMVSPSSVTAAPAAVTAQSPTRRSTLA